LNGRQSEAVAYLYTSLNRNYYQLFYSSFYITTEKSAETISLYRIRDYFMRILPCYASNHCYRQ